MLPTHALDHRERAAVRVGSGSARLVRTTSPIALRVSYLPGLFAGHDPPRGSGQEVVEISQVESGQELDLTGPDPIRTEPTRPDLPRPDLT